MTVFLVSSPDGRKLRVTAPEGATQEQAIAYAQQQLGGGNATSDRSEYDPSSAEYQAKYGATSSMSGTDKFLAGAGKAYSDLGTGVKQIGAGIADFVAPRQRNLADIIANRDISRAGQLRQEISDTRSLDAPLMKTGAARVGNIAGNIAISLPTLAIPGANTVAGAGLIGAAQGFLQPSTSKTETLTNTAFGAGFGAAGQYGGQKIASALANRTAKKAAEAATEQEMNSVRDAVLKESQEAGYVVPPTAAKPTAANTALESLAGKAATRQDASFRNARTTTQLVAQDLGLPAGKPVTRGALQTVRNKAGQIYEQAKNLGPVASDTEYKTAISNLTQNVKDLEGAYPGIGSQANAEVQQLAKSLEQDTHSAASLVGVSQLLRNRAKSNFKAAFGAGGNPEKLELARAQTQAVNAVEDLLKRHMESSGNADLASAWDASRTLIAKSHQAEAALAGGNISAARLAQQLQKGRPVSGGMGVAARFADMFPEVARAPRSGAGVSKLGAAVAGTGAGAALLTGNPGTAALLALSPLASVLTRRGILSKAGQAALAVPTYGRGALKQIVSDTGELVGNNLALPVTQNALAIKRQ